MATIDSVRTGNDGVALLTKEDPRERFGFGNNWLRFIRLLSEERIQQAEKSLLEGLRVDSLQGRTFLDIGSGSGLFSLAARRLGATVHSFDYDPDSVESTAQLKARFFNDDPSWTIEQGSILNGRYVSSLGTFDIVYSWGVLHHTGHMWDAVRAARSCVKPGGLFFIALYNDCGSESERWVKVKKAYLAVPEMLRPAYVALASAPNQFKHLARALRKGRPQEYLHKWTRYKSRRGMNRWRDLVDWVGGYPYEYASVDAVVEELEKLGLEPVWQTEKNVGLGCNEFVFRSPAVSPAAAVRSLDPESQVRPAPARRRARVRQPTSGSLQEQLPNW